MKNAIEQEIIAHRELLDMVIRNHQHDILKACQLVQKTLKGGGRIFICGNGGSAADAQHLAAEFSGRYVRERPGLPAVALTTDTSALTAIANDYGFEHVFERQVQALARPGDLLWGISTSGNSANVLRAVEYAAGMGCVTLGFCGGDGGRLAGLCTHSIIIPSKITARVQEMHILIGHIICMSVDDFIES